jgi:hypothetical protein
MTVASSLMHAGLCVVCSTALAIAGCTSSPSASPNDASVPDARRVDSSGSLEDAGDAAPDGDAGKVACQPGNVSGFRSPAFVPTHPSTACNGFNDDGGLVRAYGAACIGHGASYDSCAAFAVPDTGPAADCFRCLVTPEAADASNYGAVVLATVPTINYAGCVAFLDATDAGTSCAQSLTAAATCAEYACKAGCPPVTDNASRFSYMACNNDVMNGACTGEYLEAFACIAAETGDGGTTVGTVCFDGTRPPEGDYWALAALFCGGE